MHQGILGGGCFLALAVMVGWHPRWCAFFLYVVVVCAIRYHFLVISVDDVVMHLLLFWLILLPTGKTLSLSTWRLRDTWSACQVPGAGVRLFTANLALLYLVAGISKWASSMWLEGNALFAILTIRPAWYSGGIDAAWLPLLKGLNYGALVVEPFFALLPFLAPGSRLKWVLGGLWFLFHLGIIAGLDVVFANLGCLAAGVLIFRDEIHSALSRKKRILPATPATRGKWRGIDTFAALVLLFLVGAMTGSLLQANWRKPTAENRVLESGEEEILRMAGSPGQLFFVGGLWAVGLIQQYRLLDWIDDRNFDVSLVITEQDPAGNVCGVPETDLVPPGMRGSLVLSYLVGATWLPVPAERRTELRQALHTRLAEHYGRDRDDAFELAVHVEIGRINPARPSEVRRERLMWFRCRDGRVIEQEKNLDF